MENKMGNQQANAQYMFLFNNVNLKELNLDSVLFRTIEDKIIFLKNYHSVDLFQQAQLYNISLDKLKKIRRNFVSYILSKSLPEGFVYLNIPGKESRYLINKFGVVVGRDNLLIFKNYTDRKGYVRVNVSYRDKNNNLIKYERLHRLVAKTFIPNPENKETVNHKDGNKLNNVVSNLEWNTNLENMEHAKENYLMAGGERCILSKLKDGEVKIILTSPLNILELSKIYKVSTGTIKSILNRVTWKHIIV